MRCTGLLRCGFIKFLLLKMTNLVPRAQQEGTLGTRFESVSHFKKLNLFQPFQEVEDVALILIKITPYKHWLISTTKLFLINN